MNNSPVTRFVGIDLHKHFVVAAVDAQQQIVLHPTRRIDLDDFPAWAASHLGPTDAVVLEATGNAWWLYDIVAPLVGRAVVANSLQVKWIAAAAVKTDKHDAVRLAKLLAANLIPEVWVPPQHVRKLRTLLAHRRALVKQRTAVKNRLPSVLHRHHINQPTGAISSPHTTATGGAPSTSLPPNGCAPARTSPPSITSSSNWLNWKPSWLVSAINHPGTQACPSLSNFPVWPSSPP